MKTKVSSLLAMLIFLAITVFAVNKTEKIKVKGGNCDECKTHIEKAVKDVDGVSIADWNKETKLLEVTFDNAITNLDKIEIAVAKVGHETPNHKADNEAFGNLPECCKYERKADAKKEEMKQ